MPGRVVAVLFLSICFFASPSLVQASTESDATSAETGLEEPTQDLIQAADLTIIGIYLVGIVTLGCWAGMRKKKARGSDYFLAGKSLRWPMIGLALFATNISTIHLVSFAQNGYTSGLVYGNYEWMAAFTLVILSWFFAPFYIRSGVTTLHVTHNLSEARRLADTVLLLEDGAIRQVQPDELAKPSIEAQSADHERPLPPHEMRAHPAT